MPLVALSGLALIGIVAAVLVALGFVAAIVALSLRGRPEPEPDIPPAMAPGPADEQLERRNLEKVMGWGVVFVLFFSAWIPVLWLREPQVNVDDEIELAERRVERGHRWFADFSEENPLGFGCARCHGAEAEGGVVPFTQPDTGEVVDYPVPSLNDVCSRLTIEGPNQIRDTIMQGREGTPMPSWSVRFAGPMNDQQIQDLFV